MTRIKEINSAIIQEDWTSEELSSMIDAIKFARSRLAASTRNKITIGTSVSFMNSRTNTPAHGTVLRILTKNASVEVRGQVWRVPLAMLSVTV